MTALDSLRKLRDARRSPNTPRRVKIVVALVLVYLACPIDLIPDFIPVLGQADDILLIAWALRYVNKHLSSELKNI